MELTSTFFALAVPAVLFGGVSKAGFGSGAAFAAGTILAMVVAPGQALGILLPLFMLIDLVTLKPYWRKWHWPSARVVILGGLAGVALGAALYRLTNADVIRVLIGTIALLFVAFQIARGRGWLRVRGRAFSPRVGALAGVVGGFTSFISHAGGPPVAAFLLSRGMSKTEYQATTVLIFWAINIFKFIPYTTLGLFTADTLRADLLLAPAALLGAWIGVRAHRHIPERGFFSLAYVLLVVTGAKLIWDGL